jgi:hypothetical protein
MTTSKLTSPCETIAKTLVELGRCSAVNRLILAGPNSAELMFELHRCGYARVATTATCGLPHRQYDAGLVDWRLGSIKALEATLDWLVHFIGDAGVLVVRIEARDRTTSRKLTSMLERLGFRIEAGTRCEDGLAVAARRRDVVRLSVAA